MQTAFEAHLPNHIVHYHVVLSGMQVYVVYAVAVAEPGHGNVGPLVMGVTIFAAAEAGELDTLKGHAASSNCHPAMPRAKCPPTWTAGGVSS